MSGTNNENPSISKGRQPDYDVLQEVQMGRHKQLMHIGGVFENNKGYITGQTLHGKLVLAPTQAREALQEIRAEQAQNPTQTQEQSLEQKP
ncbi:hypothetical protein [Aliiglaciecola aliphaticivorans]